MRGRLVVAGLSVLALLVALGVVAAAQGPGPQSGQAVQAKLGSAFTYQGRLTEGGSPVNVNHDFRFSLFNQAEGGSQVGSTLTLLNQPVVDGLFTVPLDFGSVFDGTALWLEVNVRRVDDTNYTTLSPRQLLTATPYALYSTSAWNLAGNTGTISTTQFLGTTDNQPLVIRTNNVERMRVDELGNVGIGTAAPADQLELTGALRLPATTDTTTPIIKSGDKTLIHTYGTENFFAGIEAGNLSTTGYWNTASGFRALYSNTTGPSNTAIGYQALRLNTTGSSNTAGGTWALASNTVGGENTASGYMALSSNTSGNWNTAIGGEALESNTTGNYNTALGTRAGNASTGSANTFIGYNAGPFFTTPNLTNAAAIGYNAAVAASNAMVLGGMGTDAVNVGIGTLVPLDRLQVAGDIRVGTGTTGCVKDADGSIIAGTCSSDARLKQNVEAFPPMLDQVARLRPVTFEWRAEEYPEYHFGAGVTNSGLIAQEVEKVLPELVTEDEHGYKAVRYGELPLVLLQAVKELAAQNAALKAEKDARIAAQQKQIESLEERIAALEQAMQKTTAAGP